MNGMASELRLRVTTATAIAVVALAVPAAWLAGPTGAVGILAAGALTVGNFWWLARAAAGAGDPEQEPDQHQPRAGPEPSIPVVPGGEPDHGRRHHRHPDRGDFPERFPARIPSRPHVNKNTSTRSHDRQGRITC